MIHQLQGALRPTPKVDVPHEVLLLTAPQAAALLGMSVRRFFQLRPSLPPAVVLGARHVRWRRAELIAWVDSLPATAQARPEPAQLKAGRAARKGGAVDQLVDRRLSAAESQGLSGAQQSPIPSNPAGVEEGAQ